MNEVKTKQTYEEWINSRVGMAVPADECWNAALASVIMPETMNIDDIQRWSHSVPGAVPTPYGEWVKYADVAGKITVQEPVTRAGGLGWEAVEKIIAPLMTKQQYDMNDFEGVRHSSVIAKRMAGLISTTEAMVRAEIVELMAMNQGVINDLHTQIVAKPEIEIPDPKDWPENATAVEVRFVREWNHATQELGIIATFSRPQPQKMTPEEMAEAWKIWWSAKPEARVYRGNAKDALLGELLKGRTIAELYAETMLSATQK
jgi:hypothetical protein